MKKLLMVLLVAIIMFGLVNVVQAEERNEAGIGLDVILFEHGDETSSNLNDVLWLKEISVAYRVDLNHQPVHKFYLVGKIKI